MVHQCDLSWNRIEASIYEELINIPDYVSQYQEVDSNLLSPGKLPADHRQLKKLEDLS